MSFSDFSFVMATGKASPKLMLRCATGQHIKSATLTARKSGEAQPYLVVTMEDLLVSSYQVGGSSGGIGPMDQVGLSFAKIMYSVNGSKAGYDLKTNKGA